MHTGKVLTVKDRVFKSMLWCAHAKGDTDCEGSCRTTTRVWQRLERHVQHCPTASKQNIQNEFGIVGSAVLVRAMNKTSRTPNKKPTQMTVSLWTLAMQCSGQEIDTSSTVRQQAHTINSIRLKI